MRNPEVENTYGLSIAVVRRLKIADRSKLKKPLYRRDAKSKSWNYKVTIGRGDEAVSFWMGFYDADAKSYAGRFRFSFTEGRDCRPYKFSRFYQAENLPTENHLIIQELFLKKTMDLLHEGTLTF